jgi:hypothetical protein
MHGWVGTGLHAEIKSVLVAQLLAWGIMAHSENERLHEDVST